MFILTIFIELESALPYFEQKPQVPNYLREQRLPKSVMYLRTMQVVFALFDATPG